MNKHRILIALLLLALLASPVFGPQRAEAHHPLRVAFVCPAPEDYWFWTMTVNFMKAAAEDLDIGLEVFYADWSPEHMRELAEEIAAWPVPPDYLIITDEKQAGGDMLEVVSRANIPVLMMVNVFTGERLERYGRPGEKYANYLAELRPDNFAAGRLIAQRLEAVVPPVRRLDGIGFAAYSGDLVTYASTERVAGMLDALGSIPEAILRQTIPAYWERDRVRRSIPLLLSRYPNVDVVWTASDGMALGALEGLEQAGRTPGRDVFVGGCGFHPEAIRAIAEGRMTVSVGGHFMDGGRLLVMLHDRYHGVEADLGEVKSQMFAIDSDNVDRYLPFFENLDFRSVDFRRFSRHLHPETGNYNFTLEDLISE